MPGPAGPRGQVVGAEGEGAWVRVAAGWAVGTATGVADWGAWAAGCNRSGGHPGFLNRHMQHQGQRMSWPHSAAPYAAPTWAVGTVAAKPMVRRLHKGAQRQSGLLVADTVFCICSAGDALLAVAHMAAPLLLLTWNNLHMLCSVACPSIIQNIA